MVLRDLRDQAILDLPVLAVLQTLLRRQPRLLCLLLGALLAQQALLQRGGLVLQRAVVALEAVE